MTNKMRRWIRLKKRELDMRFPWGWKVDRNGNAREISIFDFVDDGTIAATLFGGFDPKREERLGLIKLVKSAGHIDASTLADFIASAPQRVLRWDT